MTFIKKIVLGLTLLLASGARADSTPVNWSDRITLNGSVLTRLERAISGNYTGSAAIPPGTGDDTSSYVRVKLFVNGKITDTLKGTVSFSTGGFQGSTLAPLGGPSMAQGGGSLASGGFSERKDFMIDQAFLDYSGFAGVGVDIQAGKLTIPFWQPGGQWMVWNPLMSLEGINVKWAGEMGSIRPFADLNYSTALNKVNGTPGNPSTAADGADVSLLAVQVGLKWKTDSQWLTADVANYEFNNMQGLPSSVYGISSQRTGINILPPSATIFNDNSALNNSVDANGSLLYNYNLVQAGLEYGYRFAFAPVKGYADYVTNTMVSTNNTAMIVGATVGELNVKGSWSVNASYRDVRKDSVVGVYSDVQFMNGDVDTYGEEYQVTYMAWQNAGVDVIYENGKKLISQNGGTIYENYMFDVWANF